MIAQLCFLLMVGLVLARPEDKYTTKYDNIDVDAIMSNERLRQSYFDCLMDRGPCTPEGQELKGKIGEALETECAKCSDKQKETVEKWVKDIKQNHPKEFDELTKKYDPEGKYMTKYADKLA